MNTENHSLKRAYPGLEKYIASRLGPNWKNDKYVLSAFNALVEKINSHLESEVNDAISTDELNTHN